MKLRVAGKLAVGHAKDFRTETGAAHTEQQDIGESAVLRVFSDLAEVLVLGQLVFGDTEPAKPFRFIGPGP